MSLQMEQRADANLIKEMQAFIAREVEARANAGRNSHGLSNAAMAAFRDAFLSDGLNGVDDLIAAINEHLIQQNAKQGLREGCGLEHGKDGDPAFLHILFVDFHTDIALFGVSIPL